MQGDSLHFIIMIRIMTNSVFFAMLVMAVRISGSIVNVSIVNVPKLPNQLGRSVEDR